jgi:predicted TIM-barrel fold metal-dependent hydrolase
MARSYPDVPAFVLGQMGRKWLVDEALMVAERTPNIFLETSDATIAEIRDAVRRCGADKVLYASHGQIDQMEQHLARHRDVITDADEWVKVMGLNAARILQIE